MRKRIICAFLLLLTLLPLGGCWDYRGLDELSIVTGIAIDKKTDGEGYMLTYEIVDLSDASKEKGPKRKLIESEGKTLFESVRNAKRRINNKLYFGHAEMIIISEELARSEDMRNYIDFFIRDAECRQTMGLIVSQEKTARDVLATEGLGQTIVANELFEILEEDSKYTPSVLYWEVYQVFNILDAKGQELALPAVHNVQNDGRTVAETNGVAIFKDDKLIGFLSPEESKYLVFILDKVRGGIIAVPASEESPAVTLEILKNTTDISFEYKDDKLKFKIKFKTVAFLDEYMGPTQDTDEKRLGILQNAANTEIEKQVGNVIKKLQNEFGSDVVGFGNMIYKKDLKLWKQLGDNWDEHFKTLEVEVKSDVEIINTASIKITK